MANRKTKDVAYCALFVALMTASSFFRIPTPFVPVTLQVQIALLAGVVLGPKCGGISIALYMLLGLLGIPIFAGGGGFAYLLQPTFGFILGFAVSAVLSGAILHRRKQGTAILFAMSVGVIVLYAVGFLYGALIITLHLKTPLALRAFAASVLLLLPKDILLTVASVPLVKRLLAAKQ